MVSSSSVYSRHGLVGDGGGLGRARYVDSLEVDSCFEPLSEENLRKVVVETLHIDKSLGQKRPLGAVHCLPPSPLCNALLMYNCRSHFKQRNCFGARERL